MKYFSRCGNFLLCYCLLFAFAAESAAASKEEQLRQRYRIEQVHLPEDDQGNLSGTFYIRGNLTPQLHWWDRFAQWIGIASSRRAPLMHLALNWINSEANLLDGEGCQWRNRGRRLNKNYAHIRFQCYIGSLQVKDIVVHVRIAPNGTIMRVGGKMLPVSKKFVSLLTQQQVALSPQNPLNETKMRGIIAEDLDVSPLSLKSLRTQHYISVEKPHLVWIVEVQSPNSVERFIYTIDGRNGDIVKRQSVLRF